MGLFHFWWTWNNFCKLVENCYKNKGYNLWFQSSTIRQSLTILISVQASSEKGTPSACPQMWRAKGSDLLPPVAHLFTAGVSGYRSSITGGTSLPAAFLTWHIELLQQLKLNQYQFWDKSNFMGGCKIQDVVHLKGCLDRWSARLWGHFLVGFFCGLICGLNNKQEVLYIDVTGQLWWNFTAIKSAKQVLPWRQWWTPSWPVSCRPRCPRRSARAPSEQRHP